MPQPLIGPAGKQTAHEFLLPRAQQQRLTGTPTNRVLDLRAQLLNELSN
jgi:hypothetical protein